MFFISIASSNSSLGLTFGFGEESYPVCPLLALSSGAAAGTLSALGPDELYWCWGWVAYVGTCEAEVFTVDAGNWSVDATNGLGLALEVSSHGGGT